MSSSWNFNSLFYFIFHLNLGLTAHSRHPELAVVADHGEAGGGADLGVHLGLVRYSLTVQHGAEILDRGIVKRNVVL